MANEAKYRFPHLVRDRAVVDLRIPDDVGTITRESDGSGYRYERYKWTISDVGLPVEAGAWFIGLAPETTGETAYSYPCYSHATLAELVRSEAGVLPNLKDPFIPLEVPDPQSAWGGVDLAFKLFTDVYGQDDNGNGLPDECENGLPCDLNFDESVDYDDYLIFLDAFGGIVDGNPPEDGICDYDESGAVGMADYRAWLQCYRDYVGDPLAGPPTDGGFTTPGMGTMGGDTNTDTRRIQPTGTKGATSTSPRSQAKPRL